MIWNKKTANVGDERTVKKFAWLPTEVDIPKYTIVWFEWFYVDYKYCEYGWGNMPFAWILIRSYVK